MAQISLTFDVLINSNPEGRKTKGFFRKVFLCVFKWVREKVELNDKINRLVHW